MERMGAPGDDNSKPDVDALPAEVLARVDGQLDGRVVLAWSEYDLDDANRYALRYAVLTDRELIAVADGAAASFPITAVQEAKIVEGLGADRLRVISGGKVVAELRYTHRHRRGMTRLHRKLERRLPRKEGEEAPPEWLDSVERQAEEKDRCPKCGELIPAYAEGVCPRCLQQRKILWRLLDVAKPYRKQVWLALALTILVSAMAVLPAIFQRNLIDAAIEPRRIDSATGQSVALNVPLEQRVRTLLYWSALLGGAVIVSEALAGLRVWMLARIGTLITTDLRHRVYAHLHDLSLRFFAKRRTGSLITRVTNDTDRLWDFIVFGSVDLIRDVAMIVAIAAVMFWLNWHLALVALTPLPVLAVITYHRGMKMQKMFGRLWTYWSRMTAVVGDAVPGVRVIKAFANEDREVARFDRRSTEYSSKEMEIHRVWSTLQPIVSGLMRLGALLIWIVGGYMVIRYPSERNTFGTLVAFTSFVWQFYQPIMELANSNRMVTRAATSAQRVFEILDTPPEIYSKPGAVKKDRLEGRVEFRQVSFSYEGTAPALREVSLTVEPGEMIGLCGPSGAGKSTFVNLICRFYDVTDGQILIDGVDERDYDVKWLRQQVGIVLQEPYLFHGTVAENIAYGQPDATPEQIIQAAKAANAHDFIVGFPDGYDTMVGERGQSLSGGERQRISIARAILNNPRLLILDEATSSVDSETEKQIQEALDRLVAGRTTFAIAHRLSTLQAADRLVVLEKGKIAEQGTHAELVDKEGGVYAKLHKTQMELATQVAVG
jgi:ATP-binding cassette, subfamily B, bacterial